MKNAKPALLLSITIGIVCLGAGYFIGSISAKIESAKNSQLNAIRADIDNLVALNSSSSDFERVTLLSTRARLIIFVCENYRNLKSKQKIDIQNYIKLYNSLVRNDHDESLPLIENPAVGTKVESQYCKVSKSKSV